MTKKPIRPSLKNPFAKVKKVEFNIPGEIARATGAYSYNKIHNPNGVVARLNAS